MKQALLPIVAVIGLLALTGCGSTGPQEGKYEPGKAYSEYDARLLSEEFKELTPLVQIFVITRPAIIMLSVAIMFVGFPTLIKLGPWKPIIKAKEEKKEEKDDE